jgi:hypothetical protein
LAAEGEVTRIVTTHYRYQRLSRNELLAEPDAP